MAGAARDYVKTIQKESHPTGEAANEQAVQGVTRVQYLPLSLSYHSFKLTGFCRYSRTKMHSYALESQKIFRIFAHTKILFFDLLTNQGAESRTICSWWSNLMSLPGIVPDSRMRRRPLTRKISMRSVVHHLAGPEVDYPVYRFSGAVFVERPKHNPFAGL